MLRAIIKNTLRLSGEYFPRVPNKSIMKKFSDPHSHIFYGYYDVSPFSIDNNKREMIILKLKDLY